MNIYLETAEKLRKLGINETKMSQEQLSKNGGMRALRSMWGGIYEVERGAMKYSFLYFI